MYKFEKEVNDIKKMPCEQCIHEAVCAKKREIINLCNDITLTKEYQELVNNDFEIKINCKNFINVKNQKIVGEING